MDANMTVTMWHNIMGNMLEDTPKVGAKASIPRDELIRTVYESDDRVREDSALYSAAYL